MRIAQIAPLWEPVPPTTYGGTELVVHLLTEALVQRGHEVTLFASQGSVTRATFVECSPQPLRAMEEAFNNAHKTQINALAYENQMLGRVLRDSDQFDVIHNHLGFQALPFADLIDTPMVTTLHNAIEDGAIRKLYQKHAHLPYISISDYQQTLWPELHYAATIHHGIDTDKFSPCFNPDKQYLAYFGRIAPEKGAHLAVQAALATGKKLVMAGKISHVDEAYHQREVAPYIDGEQITYIGELDHAQKVEFLRNAAALLHPVQWPEPFGLALVEAMACGTPVLALRDGSIPEVIDHGVSGYVADSIEELIEAVKAIGSLQREQCRQSAVQRFSAERMVDEHVRLYEHLSAQRATAAIPNISSLDVAREARTISAPDVMDVKSKSSIAVLKA